MQSENRLLEDLAKMAGGAFSSFSTLKDEAEARLHEKLEKILIRMDLVKRDEFEAVQAMAAKARTENADLTKQLKELNAKVEVELKGRMTTSKKHPKTAKRRTKLESEPSRKDD